ncbi:hypothetical protein QBC43DRAFT_125078 [Cladorrhinum sp. PSN259]|nr:hypothetical protein QBC43DRAFT_125078 [Cladorrhinum sp. PSN259]
MTIMYTRNVIVQVVERHFIKGIRDIFSITKFFNADDETVEAIIAESPQVKEQRKALATQKQNLDEALTIIQRISTSNLPAADN